VPEFLVYGRGIEAAMVALGPVLEAVGAASSLLLGSNAMLGEAERRVSLRARTLALARARHVLFDWNLRLHRWRDAAEAINLARLMCEGALLVKLNVGEATLLTGEADPSRAAHAVCSLGARLALVTLGPEEALLRGEAVADAPGVPARASTRPAPGMHCSESFSPRSSAPATTRPPSPRPCPVRSPWRRR
jgi:sugar/nucleoside kinase (ribokinase family)